MKVYGGVDVQIHIFLTSALAGGEPATSATVRSLRRISGLKREEVTKAGNTY
jgi:hypothetical protein